MSSKLKAQLEALGPTRDIDRVRFGSPVDLVLRPAGSITNLRSIDATMALARRGLSLLKAKRTIEAMMVAGEAHVHVPTIEALASLTTELREAGVIASRLAGTTVDVKAIRNALGLTQEQFALRFGLDISSLQNWEQGRSQPDRPSAAYLRAIAANPRDVALAQEEAL